MLAVSVIAAAFAFMAPLQEIATTPSTTHPRPAVRAAGHTTSLVAVAKRAPQPPTIDGKDDDVVWQDALRISDFRQFQPKADADPRFKTEFRVAYDARNLYVFVRMFDPSPDSIMHALSRRDVRGPSDQIKLLIDSYDDKRSGYELAVNPDGVKRDFVMSNDSNEDESWNGIWDVATLVDSLGWTAEFRVPMSQLRYQQGAEHTFGFGVWRDIERYAEREAWPAYSPTKNGLVSQLGRLTGLAGISSARRLEVTPYVVTKNVQRTDASGAFSRDQQLTVGGDLKFGITPNVTLDATVNPDFGQVESDPAVLNLSAFEVFQSERRPFFVEGTGLYQFQLNCYIVVDCSTNEGLFYSRRIGRSPTLRGLYGDNSTADVDADRRRDQADRAHAATGSPFGMLDAVTDHVIGTQGREVEPRTNYAVLRAQQDLRGGQAGFSVIGTAVNRSLDDLSSPYMHSSAYATGATARNRFHNGRVRAQRAADGVAGAGFARGDRPHAAELGALLPAARRRSRRRHDAHLARRPRRAAQVRQVRRRHHALRDQPRAAVGGLRGERHRLPPARRHHQLEHLGRALLPDGARDLSLGAAQRQSLGSVEHLRRAPRQRLERQRTHGAEQQLGRAPRGARSRTSRRPSATAARAAARRSDSRAGSSRGAGSTPTAGAWSTAACGSTCASPTRGRRRGRRSVRT